MGGIFIICAGGLTGMYMSMGLKRRIAVLLQLQKAVMYIVGEIEYVRTPLPVVLRNWGNSDQTDVGTFFMEMGERLEAMTGETFAQVWHEMINDEKQLHQLREQDRKELDALGNHFDVEALKLYLMRVNKTIEESEREEKDKGKIYRTLGILSGIFITIILI